MWPVILNWDGAVIYSYPLFIGLSWGLAYRLAEARLPAGLSVRAFTLWFLGAFLFAWIGAKVLFLLTQDQFAVIDLALASNFWLGGGFVFLGGFLGGLVYTLLCSLMSRELSWKRMQFTIVPLLWGHAVGRIGCFLAGCCFGAPTELALSVHLHGADRHPVQLYEAFSLMLLAALLQRKERLRQKYLVTYLLGYGLIRWSLEWLRGDGIRGAFLTMSTSQWVSLGMVAAGLLAWFQEVRKPKAAD